MNNLFKEADFAVKEYQNFLRKVPDKLQKEIKLELLRQELDASCKLEGINCPQGKEILKKRIKQ